MGNLPFRIFLEFAVIYYTNIISRNLGLYIAFTANNNASKYEFFP